MLETISAIASVFATVIGSLKGLVDLYQAIKSILPALTAKTASQLLIEKDKKNKYESVYEVLTIFREYMAEIFKRIRTQYIDSGGKFV